MNGLDRSVSREEKERRDSGGFADENLIDHDEVDRHSVNEVLSQRTTSKSLPKWIELPSSEQQIVRVNALTIDKPSFFDLPQEDIYYFLSSQLVFSRIFVFFIQLLFGGRDYSTDAFKGVPTASDQLGYLDVFLQRLVAGFNKWDAIHFMQITKYGYIFETSLAFFPVFPYSVRLISYCWATSFIYAGLVHPTTAHMLSATMLNFVSFFVTGHVLFRICRALTRSCKCAVISVILFAFNPASIFFSASYSESLFALFTFSGILLLVDDQLGPFSLRLFLSLPLFMLGYGTRSNGLLNLGYVAFYCGREFLWRPTEIKGQRQFILSLPRPTIIRSACLFISRLVMSLLLVICVVYYHSARERRHFCTNSTLDTIPPVLKNFAVTHDLVMPGQVDKITWCRVSSFFFPPFYSAIQSRYWAVSLFGYWQIKKLPCFLLAAPAVWIVAFGVLNQFRRISKGNIWRILAEGGDLIPFTLHAVFLCCGSLLIYNAEVFTRILFSSSPFAYIVLAKWMSEVTPQVRLSDTMEPSVLPFVSHFFWRGGKAVFIYFYFTAYFVCGTSFHAMFLPFT
ncbi:hypothetical protein WR25_11539 [Diploscapter pachys]|uniref:GPI mannosyltransferase 2 n=1 Tax=Diploscapter pachys TaxID=2018661 RepID=A0A2A2JT14_9BILA|nr:hypothetical protein WR25_11539 [Diploscapter pachys]